jgi:hypothetical protein
MVAELINERMSKEQWWNDTDRGIEVLGEKHYTLSVVDE